MRSDFLRDPLRLLLAAIYFLMSLRFAAPGVTAGDSPELAAACHSLGSAHAPGYPLYVLMGRLFMDVPIGSPAFRLTLLSITVQTIAFILLSGMLECYLKSWFPDVKTGRISTLTAFFWMISPLVHSQVTSPEVYSLNLFFVVILAYCLIRPDAKCLLIASFTFGLALAHHHLILLILPALFWAFRSHLARPKSFITSTASTLLGLSLYLTLPLRSIQKPFVNWGDPSDLAQFLFHVGRIQYGGNIRSGTLADGFADLGVFLKDLAIETWFIGLVFVLLGFWFSRRALHVPLLLAFGATLLGVPMLIRVPTAIENVRVMEAFFPPMLVLAAPFATLGVLGSLQTLKNRGVRLTLLILMATVLLARIPWAAGKADRSRDLSGEDLGRNILQCMPRDSVLYSEGDTATFPLAYLKGVTGLRPDAEIFDRTGGLFSDLYGLLKAERRGFGLPVQSLVHLEKAHEVSHPHPAVFYSEKEAAPGRALAYAGLIFRVTGDGTVVPVPRPDFSAWGSMRPPRVEPDGEYLPREAASRYHVMKGEYLLGRNLEGARTAFAMAERIGHDNARLFINIGVAYLEAGLDGEAAERFLKASDLAPGMPLAWYNRAYAAARLKDREGAIRSYREAIRLDPRYTVARNNLAYLLMDLQRGPEAVEQWEAILEYDPGFMTAHRDLGLVLFQARPDAARRHLELYLSTAPPGPGPDYVRKLLLGNKP